MIGLNEDRLCTMRGSKEQPSKTSGAPPQRSYRICSDGISE